MILSEDLRRRTVEAIVTKNMSITEASKTFQVGRNAVYAWLKIYKKTGTVTGKTGYQKGHSHKITDLDSFKEFVLANKECTTAEMAIRWSSQKQQKISKSTILRFLKKIGFTYKKKLLIILKQMKKNENSF